MRKELTQAEKQRFLTRKEKKVSNLKSVLLSHHVMGKISVE